MEGSSAEGEDTRVSVDRSDRQVWVVKVPQFVDAAWREAAASGDAPADGSLLGTVSESKGAFSLELAGASLADGRSMPKRYKLTPQSGDLTCMHAVSRRGSRFAVEGKVGSQFILQPVATGGPGGRGIDQSYRKISRERLEKKSVKVHHVTHIRDDDRAEVKVTPLPVSFVGSKYKREAGRKQSDNKRVKMENKEDLQKWLFDLFRRQPYWKFADIQKETQQPTRFLMDTLIGCATKVHQGDFANHWQLSEKYRLLDD